MSRMILLTCNRVILFNNQKFWPHPNLSLLHTRNGEGDINPSNPADIARHDRMIALVTQMLEIRFWPSGQRRIREERISVLRWLNKKLQDATLDHEKTLLSRQVEATDASIDKLVYELYGLTDEEIAVVEGNAK